jgi:alpha-L-fucosidase 2
MNTFLRVALLPLSLACVLRATPAESLDPAACVRFDQPGKTFREATVQGNGRLGAMDLGGAEKERIVLNEQTMWSGGAYDGNNYTAHEVLPEIRAKILAGDIEGAEKLRRANSPATRAAR